MTQSISVILVAGLVAAVGWAVLSLPEPTDQLTSRARHELTRTGVASPVTACLLNYRAYDTALELSVLFLVLVAARSLVKRRRLAARAAAPVSPLVLVLARVVVPATVVVAGALLWSGSHTYGGAFQAGALLASAGVLLRLADRWPPQLSLDRGLGTALVVVGLVVFLAVGSGVIATGRRFLEYPPESAGVLILSIEAAAMLSIAAILVALVATMDLPWHSRGRK